MRSLIFDHGTSTRSLCASDALRIRVRRSAIGSVNMRPPSSPARLGHARDLSAARELPQADPAELELAIEAAGPPARQTAVVGSHLELRPARGLHPQTGLRHCASQLLNGIPSARSRAFPSLSVRAVVTIETVKPFTL